VVTRRKSLYELFADYDDERLLRILTAERAMYRPEALTAAEQVLTRRGVPTPTFFPEPEPPAQHVGPRAQNPYQFIDLWVDALLLVLVVWGWTKVWVWTEGPYGGGPLSGLAYWVLTFGFLCSVYSLRQKWRAMKWRD
jgi:hypothetical protein